MCIVDSRWRTVLLYSVPGQEERIINKKIYSNNKYSKCTNLENQLQMVRSELSSSQLIIKLLYKELKEATEKDKVMSMSIARTELKTTLIFPPNGLESELKDIVITKTSEMWNHYKLPSQ